MLQKVINEISEKSDIANITYIFVQGETQACLTPTDCPIGNLHITFVNSGLLNELVDDPVVEVGPVRYLSHERAHALTQCLSVVVAHLKDKLAFFFSKTYIKKII